MTYPNHIRTVLMNRQASGLELPGAAYTSPKFTPIALPTSLRKIQHIVLGATADQTQLNLRMFQLLQLLHATELREFMVWHDPRITYLPLQLAAVPAFDTARLLADMALLRQVVSTDDSAALFGLSAEEPYRTFQNLWQSHDFYAYKVGGLALGLAFRMSEMAA